MELSDYGHSVNRLSAALDKLITTQPPQKQNVNEWSAYLTPNSKLRFYPRGRNNSQSSPR